MKREPSAASGGTESLPAPQTQASSQRPSLRNEAYRQFAVEELALHLARGGALLERCEELAKATYGDQVGAIRTAARLLNANAQLAKVFAQVAQVERRSRTIIETIQRPDPKIAELNAAFPESLKSGEIRAVLECGLRLLLQQQKQDQKEREAPAIEYFI